MFSDINMRCQEPTTVNCGSRAIPDGYMCDFETTAEPDCFLENSKSDIFDWTRKTGSTGSSNTGPSSAYHGRFYTYIETSSPRKLGDNAILESKATFQERLYCLYLFYHMHGSHVGNLTIKTKEIFNNPVVLKQLSGEQGNKWKKMSSLNVRLNGYTKILIEATRGSSYEGDISIDLVMLLPRKVSGQRANNFSSLITSIFQNNVK
ncbi:MAM and LDL-receptor class A domain-containing protein 1-like [Saccostrea cucullata]|uniref:MAM and LDL-receptor class A domain-containing protein 1-like n=1 Tax=Saccostrea cuccullata TaxID=36930 RepID=UPI002ED1EB8E